MNRPSSIRQVLGIEDRDLDPLVLDRGAGGQIIGMQLAHPTAPEMLSSAMPSVTRNITSCGLVDVLPSPGVGMVAFIAVSMLPNSLAMSLLQLLVGHELRFHQS
jgi:hypothetical protein